MKWDFRHHLLMQIEMLRSDTPGNQARFARAYEMLVESVHLGLSARDIGALRGISGARERQLMVYAAYTWAGRAKVRGFHRL
jgi:hypothetical protein